MHNSITAKTTGLIFALFDVASAREVLGILQYVQCILQGLTGLLLCVLFIFADSESVNLVVAHDSFLCMHNKKSSVFFIVATFITEVLFKHFLIRTAVYNELSIADREG